MLIFCLVALASSQLRVETKPFLVDQFADPNCEDLWARLDGFLSQLNRNPDTIGTVTISGKIGDLRNDLMIEDMIRRYFARRNVSPERFQILRLKPETQRMLEFWITPAGGETPKLQTAEWSLVYPTEAKPFIFAVEPSYDVEINICLYSDPLALLSKVLRANQDACTNVVLKVRSQKEYLRRKRRVISNLITKYGIQRQRIRIFKQVTHETNTYGIYPDIEYWFVP
jgi:hypothetical protein